MVAGIFSEWFHVVGEVHVLVGSPEGEPHEGVSPRVFWNFKRTHEKENLTDTVEVYVTSPTTFSVYIHIHLPT
jgi:hypothetical protein